MQGLLVGRMCVLCLWSGGKPWHGGRSQRLHHDFPVLSNASHLQSNEPFRHCTRSIHPSINWSVDELSSSCLLIPTSLPTPLGVDHSGTVP